MGLPCGFSAAFYPFGLNIWIHFDFLGTTAVPKHCTKQMKIYELKKLLVFF